MIRYDRTFGPLDGLTQAGLLLRRIVVYEFGNIAIETFFFCVKLTRVGPAHGSLARLCEAQKNTNNSRALTPSRLIVGQGKRHGP